MKEIDHRHVQLVFVKSDSIFEENDTPCQSPNHISNHSKYRKSILRKAIVIISRNFAKFLDITFSSSLHLPIIWLTVKSPWSGQIRKILQQKIHFCHRALGHSRIASSIIVELGLPVHIQEKSWLICLAPTMAPRQRNCRLATFVHDLIALDFFTHGESRSAWLSRLNCCCQNSDIIICVSHTTAKRLILHNPSVKRKVRVIYPSISEISTHNSRESQSRYTLPISLCSIDSVEPRKNWPGILQALLYTVKLPPIQFTFIGGEPSCDPGFHRRLRDLTCKLHEDSPHSVIFAGRVSAEEKCKYLQQSAAFVYVPFMEGAALPIIEAQLLGCPTLISDLPVFREFIHAENAYFADPNQPASIGAALQKLCTDLKNGKVTPAHDSHFLAPLASPTRFAREVMAALVAADCH